MLGIIFLAFSVFMAAAMYLLFSLYFKESIRSELRQEVRIAISRELNTAQTGLQLMAKNSPLDTETAEIDAAAREVSSELAKYEAGNGIQQDMPGGIKIGQAANAGKDESVLEYSAGQGEAKKERAIEEMLVDKGGMLLPKGRFQVEPSLSMAHFSSNRINIEGFSILPVLVIGEISTETVKRDVIIETNSLKYGLLKNLQAELKVPFRYEYDRVTNNAGAESHRYAYGLGDIEFGLSRQIAWESGFVPDTVFSLLVKTDSGRSPYGREIGLGTGHWGIRPTLIMVKSSDPAVVFANVYYTWNIVRHVNDFGKVDPGDTLGYGLGVAIGLSYQTAINFQFGQNVTFKMKKDDITVKGSFLNAADFKCGFTWSFNERFSMDVGADIGLTSDAPDFVFELRFPYSF